MSFICLVFEAEGEMKEQSDLEKEKAQFIRFNSYDYFIPTFTLLGLGYNLGFGRSFGFSLMSTIVVFSVISFFSGSGSNVCFMRFFSGKKNTLTNNF